MIKAASWPKALSTCEILPGFFMPDLGKEEIISNILPQMEEWETIWLNAKEIILEYKYQGNLMILYLEAVSWLFLVLFKLIHTILTFNEPGKGGF